MNCHRVDVAASPTEETPILQWTVYLPRWPQIYLHLLEQLDAALMMGHEQELSMLFEADYAA
jgi:hypothetical protein